MAFITNYTDVNDSGLKPEGDYECIITNIQERTNRNNKTKLGFTLTIRNDVDQKYKNGCLFYDLWKAREPSPLDMSANGYIHNQIMSVAKAASLPEGKDYADLYAFLEALKGKCVIAHLEHEEFNGKTQEKVRWLKPTNYPDCKHELKNKPVSSTDFATTTTAAAAAETDDDYPF